MMYLTPNESGVDEHAERVAVADNTQLVVRLVYEDYEPSLPVDPTLFQPPAGIPISETKF